ncbi:hypothetical protein BKA66DRAFT_517363 [Pyrenochaeta sp. MPI-SDFR-AT-0127]|nr:hypothetical protein BKA66DRAFT_517363 [Pyrenochaeta sp. MPI-SDFR-AT-0127]
MVLKLYGSAMSTSRDLTTIFEKQLRYELIRVDIKKGELKREDFKQLQPFGKVPILDDDGSIMMRAELFASILPAKHAKSLSKCNGDLAAYSRFEQACSIEQSYFADGAETIGTELYIKPYQNSDAALGVYEKILARQRYLAGDDITLADLFQWPNGAAMKSGKWNEIFVKYPNIAKWFKELLARNSWLKASSEADTIR